MSRHFTLFAMVISQTVGTRIKRLRACLLDRDGVAAVEFALVFPVLLLVFVGAVDVSQAVTTSSKVETLTRTLTDLVSRQATYPVSVSSPYTASTADKNAVQAETLSTIASASAGLLYPASTASLTMTISAIDIVNNTNGKCCSAYVRWSYTQSASSPTLRPCGAPLTAADTPSLTTIPSALVPDPKTTPSLSSSISVLIADVSYTYTPLFNSVPFPTITRTGYMYPRNPGQVVVDNTTPPSAGQLKVCY